MSCAPSLSSNMSGNKQVLSSNRVHWILDYDIAINIEQMDVYIISRFSAVKFKVD